MENAPDIYSYTQCHLYLSDWFTWAKKSRKQISLASLSLKLGIKSKSQLHRILHDPKPPMGAGLIHKFSEVLGHSDKEREYFSALVGFSRASSVREKGTHYSVMHRIQPMRPGNSQKTSQYDYFANPNLPILREALCLSNFDGNIRTLGQRLIPPVTEASVKAMIHSLWSMGLIEALENGCYRQTDAVLDTGHDVVSLAVSQFHKEMALRAVDAIMNLPSAKRQIGALTFAFPSKKIEALREKVRLFQEDLIQYILTETEATDQVYQMNLHLFPHLSTNQ